MKLHNLFEEQIDEIAGAFPTPSAQQAMYKAAAQSNAAEAKRQAELAKQADAERLQKNTELVDKEQKVNYHSLDAEPKTPVKEGDDERKQNALWAQITAHEKAAKKSKDLKKQHHLKMADQLRSQLKTSDNEGVEEGLEEGANDTIYPNAEVIKSKNGKPVGEIYQDAHGWGCFHYKADRGADCIESREEALEWLKDIAEEYRQDRSLRENWIKLPNGNYRNTYTGVQQSSPPKKEKRRVMPKGNYNDEANPIRDDGNEGRPGKQNYPGMKESTQVAQRGQIVQLIKVPRMIDLIPGETFEVSSSDAEGVTLKHGLGTKFDNVKFPHGTYRIIKSTSDLAEGRDMCSVCGQTPCNCTHLTETRAYYNVIGTPDAQLRSEFGMRKDRNGWFLKENVDKRKQLAAFRAFGAPKLKEFNLANFSGSAATKGEDNIISPVGSGRKGK